MCGAQISDLRYGCGSAAQGLKHGRLCPSADFRRMEELGAVVHEHLRRRQECVPFPFRDRSELWLLDAEDRPLALLHSAVDARELPASVWPHWRVGLAAQSRFSSAVLGEDGAPGNCAEYLAAYINRRAGDPARAQWFLREIDGSGKGMQVVGGDAQELPLQHLTREAFPALCLSVQGHDPAHPG